jgi:hypothetical protein
MVKAKIATDSEGDLMKGFGFSIKGMLAAVAFVAVGVYCLVSGSSTWLGVLIALTILLFGTAILNVIYCRDAQRAFWLGFCVFGGVTVMFAHGFAPEVWRPAYMLAVEHISGMVEKAASIEVVNPTYSQLEEGLPNNFSQEHVQSSLAFLSTWCFGLVGGLVASYLYATRHRN